MRSEVKPKISHLAHQYYSSYTPRLNDLKKAQTLKMLGKNKDVVITKPNKCNSVVI